MTKYKHQPETLAEKDVTYIRMKFQELKQNGLSTANAIKEIKKEYNKEIKEEHNKLSFGRIQWYLKELADDKREQDKQRQDEANQRQREQRQQKRWEKKDKYKIGEIPLHDKTMTWFSLIPVGKDLRRESGKFTESNFEKYLKMVQHLVSARVMYKTKELEKTADEWEFVTKFCEKNDYPSGFLGVNSRSLLPSLISSPLRGTRMKERTIALLIKGKARKLSKNSKTGKLGVTAGCARIKNVNEKHFLHVGSKEDEMIFEIYIRSDSEDDKYYEDLLRRINNVESMDMRVSDERKWGKGFQAKVSGVKQLPEFNYCGEQYITVLPVVEGLRGKYKVRIYDDSKLESDAKKLTFNVPWHLLAHADGKRREGVMRTFIAKTVKEIDQKRDHKKQPIVIYFEKQDDGSHKDLSSWLCEGKMFNKLLDKLSWVKGRMSKVDGQPQDLNSCLTRLSI